MKLHPQNFRSALEDDLSSAASYQLTVTSLRGVATLDLEAGHVYAIGASADADLRVDDPLIGDEHAIVYGGDPPELVDLGSLAGTWAGAERLTPGQRHSLREGRPLVAGRSTLVARRADPSTSVRAVAGVVSERDQSGPTRDEPAAVCVRLTSGYQIDTCTPKMLALIDLIRNVAASNVGALIFGETGVGKEVVARAIHELSPRRSQQLVTVNCAAIPEALMESELFGYERGAFSGAATAKPGLFEVAHRGTLFLDELGELSKPLQAKLLRVLESREVQRLGAIKPRQIDVRIVAATNCDLLREVAEDRFRADLYYRLNGMTFTLPPLRERVADVPLLANDLARRASPASPPRFSSAAMSALQAHTWPGNVRELRTVVQRAVMLANGEVIGTKHIVLDVGPPSARERVISSAPPRQVADDGRAPSKDETFTEHEIPTGAVAAELHAELARREERHVRAALSQAGGNQKDAAKLLGVSRRTLINRLERYGIERPRKARAGTRDA